MSKEKQKYKFKYNITLCLLLSFFFGSSFFIFYKINEERVSKKADTEVAQKKEPQPPVSKEEKKEIPSTQIIINSVGDCTIGNDENFSYDSSLPAMFKTQNSDFGYFFKNVIDTFKKDDYTIANLETTFTKATAKADKQFTFKADPTYSKTLSQGSVEAVNLSNNHIYDYLKQGFEDTKVALKNENIAYFGEGFKVVKEIKGIPFGFLGYRGWNPDATFLKTVKTDIEALKAQNCIVIINFHWGEENVYYPNEAQKQLAHYAIDRGADLILGHHPHVMQGIEKYKNRFIAYSLANFCFGGNNNPQDKDTFILQSKFNFTDKALKSMEIQVLPASISSVEYKNDYCPTLASGEKATNILEKLNKLSSPFGTNLKGGKLSVEIN